jgi:hypothetical protein
MLDLGISANDIRTMVKTNPERLLDLEPVDPEKFPVMKDI